MNSIRKILEAVAKEHPYRIPSRRETYDKYNEGWTDAVDRIESMLPEQTETQCYLGSPCEYQNPDVKMPSAEPDVPDINVGDINKFIDDFEAMFADIRERHVDNSVCGLCEYDGAYMGQSGDWCNECPGFDKDDCFKLSDKIRKEWTEIIKSLPSVQPKLDPEALVHTIEMGITATNSMDVYSLGMRNGMRWCKSLIDGVEPKFEDYVMSVDDWKELPSAQPETATVTRGRTKGETILWYECDACGETVDENDNYCSNCGRKLKHE